MSNGRNLPTYEKSVGLQIAPQANTESAANAMINSFRNFSESVASFSQGISKEEATQQREVLKNNISTSYRQFSLMALKNPDQNAGLSGYLDSSKQYGKQLLQQTDKFNRPYVQNLLDYYHSEHQTQLEKNAILQNKRIEQVGAYERIDNASQDWKNAVNNSKRMVDENGEDVQFNAAKALFAEQIKNMEVDATHGLIPPERLGSGRKQLQKEFTDSIFLKKYTDAVADGVGNQFIKELQDSNFNIPGYDIEDKTKLIGKMIHIRDQGKSGARLAIGQLKSQMSDEIVRVSNGGTPNLQLFNEVESLDEKAAEKFSRDLNVSQLAYSAKQSTFYKSPEEIQNIKNELLNIDPSDPNYGKYREVAEASIRAIDLQTKEFKANPMAAIMKNPAIKEAVNSYEQAFNSNSVGTDHNYTPYNSQVPKPWQTVINAQLDAGQTLNGKGNDRVMLLDKAQVPSMVNAVMTSTGREKIEYMSRLAEEYGGGVPFNLVIKQLVEGGMPAQFSMLAGLDPNSKYAMDAAEALSFPLTESSKLMTAKNPDNKKRTDKLIEAGIYTKGGTPQYKLYMESQAQYFGGADQNFQQLQDSALKSLAYYSQLKVGQALSPQQAVQQAQNTLADSFDYIKINGKTVRFPKQFEGNAIRDYAIKMESQLGNFNFKLNADPSSRKISQENIKRGHWVTDTTQHNLVWVDYNGVLRTDANGHPFGFSFEEAKTGVSPRVSVPTTKMTTAQEDQIDTGISDFAKANPELSDMDRKNDKKITEARKIADSRDEVLKAAIRGNK